MPTETKHPLLGLHRRVLTLASVPRGSPSRTTLTGAGFQDQLQASFSFAPQTEEEEVTLGEEVTDISGKTDGHTSLSLGPAPASDVFTTYTCYVYS